jgi:hypothetical protein
MPLTSIANNEQNNEYNRHMNNYLKPKLTTHFHPPHILLMQSYYCP